MKTKTSTKLMLGLAGSLLAIGSLKAQTTPGGKLWGYAFGDYAYSMHGDSAGRGNGIQYKGLGSASNTANNLNAWEIRRAYLGYDYTINDKFSATVLLAYEGNVDGSGNRTMYFKNGYFTWKSIFKGSNLIVGQQPTCSFATAGQTEALWGYRSIEKTLLDMRGIDGSTDMGISLAGHLWTKDTGKMSSYIGYNVMMGDNAKNSPVPVFSTAGAANSSTDKDKKFRFNVYGSLMQNQLTIGFYTDIINYGNVPYKKSSTVFQSATQTIKFYAAYNTKAFGVGFEYFMQSNTNGELTMNTTTPASNDTSSATQSGMSIFAHAAIITDKLSIFARYDMYNPDTKYSFSSTVFYTSRLQAANTYTESFITAGLDWTPTTDKKVHIMPNIWYDGISNGFGADKLKSDNYMVARLTFYYIFK
jgi:hypothetical protein